jgi:hypothetical protein
MINLLIGITITIVIFLIICGIFGLWLICQYNKAIKEVNDYREKMYEKMKNE